MFTTNLNWLAGFLNHQQYHVGQMHQNPEGDSCILAALLHFPEEFTSCSEAHVPWFRGNE